MPHQRNCCRNWFYCHAQTSIQIQQIIRIEGSLFQRNAFIEDGVRTYPTSYIIIHLLPRVAMRTLLLILYMTGRRNCWFFYEDTFWLLSCQTFQEWFWREDIPPPCAACAMITTTTTSRNNNGIDAINKGEVNKTASSSLLRARASCWCSILYIMIR